MVAAAVFTWEPWPITSFRLFSHLREDHQRGWSATLANARGEAPLAVADLSSDLRGFSFRMAEFETAPWARRDEICRAWVAPLTEAGGESEIHLYRTSWRLSRRIDGGERPAPAQRQLAFVCTAAGAQPGGGTG
jgi:hypothetical protein